jgi:hypothetical protein
MKHGFTRVICAVVVAALALAVVGCSSGTSSTSSSNTSSSTAASSTTSSSSSSTASTGKTPAYTGTDATQIVAQDCELSGCHTSGSLAAYVGKTTQTMIKTMSGSADANITADQEQALETYFQVAN